MSFNRPEEDWELPGWEPAPRVVRRPALTLPDCIESIAWLGYHHPSHTAAVALNAAARRDVVTLRKLAASAYRDASGWSRDRWALADVMVRRSALFGALCRAAVGAIEAGRVASEGSNASAVSVTADNPSESE